MTLIGYHSLLKFLHDKKRSRCKASENVTGDHPYQPLQSREHIRLLRFKRPSLTQNIPVISATLHEVSLFAVGENSCPPYKALSYEWGLPSSDPSDTPTMLLDNHPIHIRQNLHDALHSILHNHTELNGKSPLYLWVDALCINQLDNREKGHQVQLMKNIYKGAKLVIVWLGKGTAYTDETMELLKMKEGDLNKHFEEGNFSWKENQGIADIYCNATYWRRVWILQEFALARDYVILCNRAFVRKECFESGLRIAKWWSIRGVRDKWKSGTGAQTNWLAQDLAYRAPVERMIALRSLLSRPSGPTLDNWLEMVYNYGFQATDPRDYVFALLGVSRDGDKIVPDYELSATEVYYMVTPAHEARSGIRMARPLYVARLMGILDDQAHELLEDRALKLQYRPRT